MGQAHYDSPSRMIVFVSLRLLLLFVFVSVFLRGACLMLLLICFVFPAQWGGGCFGRAFLSQPSSDLLACEGDADAGDGDADDEDDAHHHTHHTRTDIRQPMFAGCEWPSTPSCSSIARAAFHDPFACALLFEAPPCGVPPLLSFPKPSNHTPLVMNSADEQFDMRRRCARLFVPPPSPFHPHPHSILRLLLRTVVRPF